MFEELKEVLFNENSEENQGLKCDLCNNYLSAPPILYNNVFGNVCSRERCMNMAHTKGENYEQLAYESVAKYLDFPCMNRRNGCQEQFRWGEIYEHELSCNFNKLPCPFWQDIFPIPINDKKKCEWFGTCSNFFNHIQENHRNKISSDPLWIPFHQTFDSYSGEILFTKVANQTVVVLLRLDNLKTILYCSVWYSFDIYKDMKYRIKILDANLEESIALRKKTVELLCPDFMKDKSVRKWTKIDLAYIEEILDVLDSPHHIVVEFEYNGIELNCNKTPKCITKPEEFIDIGLRVVKCDRCLQELVPPVYLCLCGHNICSKCKRMDRCPSCQTEFSATRNVAYEVLKLSVEQPCKNRSEGCDHRDTYPNIINHEEICVFNPLKCTLGCSYNKDELLPHLQLEHKLSILELDVFHNMSNAGAHILQFDDQIFLFKNDLLIGEEISYTIQCLGMRNIRYKYKLYLRNDALAGSEIMLSQICHPALLKWKSSVKEVAAPSTVITIPQSVLGHIMPDLRQIKFKVHLFKIGEEEK